MWKHFYVYVFEWRAWNYKVGVGYDGTYLSLGVRGGTSVNDKKDDFYLDYVYSQ